MIKGCPLILAYDDDAGLVTIEDLPAGPAGEAIVVPVDGIELHFDCADGRLSRALIDAGQPGGQVEIGESVIALVTRLFGSQAYAAIQHAFRQGAGPIALLVNPDMMTALSRLARMDAARVTSPAAASPLWAVEAALLATQAGLGGRARAETRRAVRLLEDVPDASLTGALAAAARTVAELVQAAEPDLAKRLRDHAAVPRLRRAAAAHSDRSRPAAVPDIQERDGHRDSGNQHLQWWLDPHMLAPGFFQHRLWPDSELTVRTGECGLIVEARLAPGADHGALGKCRARLVDPVSRKVIGTAPFRPLGDSGVSAEIRARPSTREAWVEVVDDVSRPVLSSQLRHIRRAMRWADAALTAARRPPGLRDAERARLAAAAWRRSADDWSAARDTDRACLAAARGAAICPGAVVPAPPSDWARELVGRPWLDEQPFLAETAD